jgi:hypothetical protein
VAKNSDSVNHPAHYNSHPSGVECIEIVEHLPYNIGTAMAYLWRYESKNGDEDLKKAVWHTNRELHRRAMLRLKKQNLSTTKK